MTATAVAAPPGALDLLLVRLLATSKVPPAPKAVRTLLDRFLPHALGAEAFDDLVRAARADGLLLPSRGLRLTDPGRARALALLGVEALPDKCPWKTLESRFLAPVAAGFRATTGEKPPTPDQLTARALADHLDLTVPAAATLSQIFVAMLARDLKMASETDLSRLFRRWLSRAAGSDEELSMERLKEVLPRTLLNLPNGRPEGVRTKLIRGWVARRATEPAAQTETVFDLPAFAATVRAAARDCPTGRYGDNKVFINHLWSYLRDEPSFPQFHDLAAFRARLVEANAAGLIELARADLTLDMDPTDVRESEISQMTGLFHFVTIH